MTWLHKNVHYLQMSQHVIHHTENYENGIINTMNHEMMLGPAGGMERGRTPKSEIFAEQLLQAWRQTDDNGSGKVQNISSLAKAVRFAHLCKNHEQLAYEKFLENDNDTALQCMQIARSHVDNYNIAADEYNRFYGSHSTVYGRRHQLHLPNNFKSGLFDLLIDEMQTGVKAHGYLKLANAAYGKNKALPLYQIASGLRELYELSRYQHLSQQYPTGVLERNLSEKRKVLDGLVYKMEEICEMMFGRDDNDCLDAISGYGSRYGD